MSNTITLPAGVELKAPVNSAMAQILTREALEFVARLAREFQPTREKLLARRVERQGEIDSGVMPGFLASTKNIRADKSWQVAPIPADLQDRRTEITGPVDRKMVINALNSGAKVFMADFEDATSPTWGNLIEGQANLCDSVRRKISFASPEGKQYQLNERTAALPCARAAGICRRSTCSWTANRLPAACSISVCISCTTRTNCSLAAPGHISICRNWRAIARRGCGMTFSISRRTP
jgi:malate synthase